MTESAEEDGAAAEPPGPGASVGARPRLQLLQLETELRHWRAAQAGERAGALGALRSEATARHGERWSLVADLALESVTPIYGGGTRAGEPDLLLPFRPRAIRNSIRHWWWLSNRRRREFQGAAGSVELYAQTVRLWGGPAAADEDLASKVRVTVSGVDLDRVGEAAYVYAPYRDANGIARAPNPGQEPWHYALFGACGKLRARVGWQAFESACPLIIQGPLRGKRRLLPERAGAVFDRTDGEPDLPSMLLAPGLAMNLRVEVSAGVPNPAQVLERLRLALALWLCFGGVGARTARGLGRLQVVPDGNMSLDPWAIVAPNGGSRLPSLAGNLVEPPNPTSFDSASAASQWLLETYRWLRQSRGGKGRGRSHWPEPDVVRHAAPRTTEHEPVFARNYKYLPRLSFGAPVLIDFGSRGNGRLEPNKTSLSFARKLADGGYEELERYASPLIFTARRNHDRWIPCLLHMDPKYDFARRGVHASMKIGDNHPQHLPPGKWWPDFDDKVAYERDLAAMMNPLAASLGAGTDPIDLFVDRVRRGGARRR